MYIKARRELDRRAGDRPGLEYSTAPISDLFVLQPSPCRCYRFPQQTNEPQKRVKNTDTVIALDWHGSMSQRYWQTWLTQLCDD